MSFSNPIEINKSSLLSLKAEVLRKQQEVNLAKLLSKSQSSSHKAFVTKTKTPSDPSNKGLEERRSKDEKEDEEMLLKSRRILENKARLYNRLVNGPKQLTEDEMEYSQHYLVQFDRKSKDEKSNNNEEEDIICEDDYEEPDDPDEQWVDYVDCLGRTRKCLRKDLRYIKKKDYELSKTIDVERPTPKELRKSPTPEPLEEKPADSAELLSSDMRREQLRKEWEKQEQELADKTNVHYQDVLFSEARSHGVSYFSFSRDEDERKKQQEELNKLRLETEALQKAKMEQKKLREEQLAKRLKAARNRKRARMGLPPEEDDPVVSTEKEGEETMDTSEKEKLEEKIKEEQEKEKQRKEHIRPWDIGKTKHHYECTQDEWSEKKRKERLEEFAPPSSYHKKDKWKRRDDDDEDSSDENKECQRRTAKDRKRNYDSDKESEEIGPPYHRFKKDDKKRKKTHESKTRNEESKDSLCTDVGPPYPKKNDESTVVVEPPAKKPVAEISIEISPPCQKENTNFNKERYGSNWNDKYSEMNNKYMMSKWNDDVEILEGNDDSQSLRRGTEIAPPAFYDNSGPSKSANVNSYTSLEDSIAAGLRFLRELQEKKSNSVQKREYVGE